MTYQDLIDKGYIDLEEQAASAWEMKRNALARFTSAELARELKERSNRKVIELNSRAPFRLLGRQEK